MLKIASEDLHSLLQRIRGGRPPVYVFLLRWWVAFFGPSEFAARALSAVAGILSVPLMYILARELFGRRVALVSAFFIAVARVQIMHSQDLRYYSLHVLLTLCSYLFYLQLLRKPRILNLLSYVLCTALLFYSHTFGIFVICAQVVYFAFFFRSHRAALSYWLIAQVGVAISIAPFLYFVIGQAVVGKAAVMTWIPERPLWYPLVTIVSFLAWGKYLPSLALVLGAISLLLISLLVVISCTGIKEFKKAIFDLPREVVVSHVKHKKEFFMVACWLCCPLMLPIILSQFLGPMYIHRYTISASPALYILLSLGIVGIAKVIPELVSLSIYALLVFPGVQNYYGVRLKEQWREAAAYVQLHEEPGDVLIFVDSGIGERRDAFFWYYKGELPTCTLPLEHHTEEQLTSLLNACTENKRRYWLIQRDESVPVDHINHFVSSSGATQQRELTQVTLRLYLVRPDIVSSTSGTGNLSPLFSRRSC